jgi:hypothetical protein
MVGAMAAMLPRSAALSASLALNSPDSNLGVGVGVQGLLC